MLSNLLPGTQLYPLIPDFTCIATDRIVADQVTDIPSNWTDAYWLGWVNYDNLPYAYKSFEYTKDANGIIHFEDITKQINYDVGYGINTATDNYPALLKYNENTGLWTGWDRQWSSVETNSNNMRLLNEFDINQTAVTDIILIFAFNPKLNGVGQSYTMGFLIVPVEDFLNNSFSGTISTAGGNLINFAQISGATLLTSIDITQDDIGGINTQTINGLEVDYFCCGVEVGTANAIDTAGTTLSFSIAVKPMLRMQNIINDDTYISCSYNTPDGFGFQYYCGEGVAYNATAGIIWEWEQNNISNPRPILNGSVVGGNLIGTIDTDAVRNIFGTSGVYGFYYEEPNNFVIQATSSAARMVIRRICSYEDLYKIVSLYPRLGSTNTYDNGSDKWYPYVNNNEFTTQIINGLDDRPKLTTWQLIGQTINPTNSQYEESDKPEYVPEGGGYFDEGSISLNVPGALGATNAFTTRYVLNATQIRTIGQRLWATIGDGNQLTWKNFFLTISGSDQIDYSLTLSEIISYFVSLKYFPFSLNDVSSSTGENGIRVGTGVSLIDAGSTTKTLNDSIVQLDGGRCTIPEKWNNYLDLEPYTTASLYVPYCGTTELPMSVIAGETIGITYLVDMTTGAMTAAIMKYSSSGAFFPIAIMNGSCGFDILMTGTNGNSQMTNAITNLASKSTQWIGQTLQSGLTGLMGGISGRDATGMGALGGMTNTALSIGQDIIQQNIQIPKLYATAPMTSGSSSSLSSLILPQTAYIQIRRHNPYRHSTTDYQDELGLIGYRSAYQGLIGSANGMGFVKCQNPNLANVADAGATEAEINMIKSLLSDGIFT